MNFKQIVFSGHAVGRMFERAISPEIVKEVISEGEVIQDYPEDRPYPSYLILGYVKKRPLHVVAALDQESGICYVITVYRPELEFWSDDFRTRRK